MRRETILFRLLLIFPILISLAIYLFWQVRPTILAQSSRCPSENRIVERLDTDAEWDLCWEGREQEGIVLHEVYYTTPSGLRRKILKQANLAQIHVAFDDGQRMHLLTEQGLGGSHLLELAPSECVDGTLHSHQGRAVLCQQITKRGYLYKYFNQQRQGLALNLYSISMINQQTYIVQWRFSDDGTIEPSIGRSGSLTRSDSLTRGGSLTRSGLDDEQPFVGYTNNYFWRLDFDLGGLDVNNDEGHAGVDLVEEFEVEPASNNTRRVLTVTQLDQESARAIDPSKKRSWRIRSGSIRNADGHPISVHLEPLRSGHRYLGPSDEPWSQNDFFVTRNKPCERFLTQNPQNDPCGKNVTDFVNGENLTNADLVVWYGLTAHHLPRDEDQPVMNTRWDGFQLILRDWTAQNPF